MKDVRPSVSGYLYAASDQQKNVELQRVAYFEAAIGSTSDKLNSLARFMSRQNMAKLLCYAEIFKATQAVCGSIFECGVYFGNGLMTYSLLSAALEPYNYQCKIVGFDTFEGDTEPSQVDKLGYKGKSIDFNVDSYDDLKRSISIFDQDRPLNHIPRIELVKGDLRSTAPAYLEANPHTLIRILHLSVNLYEPTRAALDAFLPRMPKGSALVIHALNYTPGATKALADVAQISQQSIRTFECYPNICYVIR